MGQATFVTKKRRAGETMKAPRDVSSESSEDESSKRAKTGWSLKVESPAVDWKYDYTCLYAEFSPKEAKVNRIDEKHEVPATVIALDLDHTIQRPLSGGIHPVHGDDWQYMFGNVPQRLREEYSRGAFVVIFSNQGGLYRSHRKSKKLDLFKEKTEKICQDLGIPLNVYAALALNRKTDEERFRKPMSGMWTKYEQWLKQTHNRTVDYATSVFVGDAAGRKHDHSDCDKEFAANIGVKFYVPEKYFVQDRDASTGHEEPADDTEDEET